MYIMYKVCQPLLAQLMSCVLINLLKAQGSSGSVLHVVLQNSSMRCAGDMSWFSASYIQTAMATEHQKVTMLHTIFSTAIDRSDNLLLTELIEPLLSSLLHTSLHITTVSADINLGKTCAMNTTSSPASSSVKENLFIRLTLTKYDGNVEVNRKNWESSCNTSRDTGDNESLNNNPTIMTTSCHSTYESLVSYNDLTVNTQNTGIDSMDNENNNDQDKDTSYTDKTGFIWQSQCEGHSSYTAQYTTVKLPLACSHPGSEADSIGSISVTYNLTNVHLNQCDVSTPQQTPQQLSHKCPIYSQCTELTSAPGLSLGSYTCTCDAYTIPWFYVNSSLHTDINIAPGLPLERHYYQTHQGTPSAYQREVFQCRSCYLTSTTCTGVDQKGCSSTLPPHSCSMLLDPSLRLPVVCVTIITMCAVLGIIGAIFRFRKEKMIRAASPGVLYITLFGVQLLYCEIIIAAFVPSDVTCMLRPWFRHIGFALTYGGLVFKTWRISIILHVFKARMLHTNAAHIYRKIALFLAVWVVFMLLWTTLDRSKVTQYSEPIIPMCRLQAWNFVAIALELSVLAWGTYLCYQARKAPDLYNETRQISYALWNEALWEVFIVIARVLLHKYPDSNLLFIVRFLRTQFTTTAMLILLYAPRFFQLFRKVREVNGTLNDVYGVKRVHRLSVMINQQGDIKTIYCVPCGPLSYLQQSEDSSSTASNDLKDTKEEEYTKAEVDSLIEMVSRLKGEKEVYQAQVKRLLKFLKQSKRNGATIRSQFDAFTGKTVVDLTHPPKLEGLPSDQLATSMYSPSDPIIAEDETCQQLYHTLFPGPRGSRASTLTTYISTTPDDLSPLEPSEQQHSTGGARANLKSPNQGTSPRPQDPLLVFDHVQNVEENSELVEDIENHNKLQGVEMISLLSQRTNTLSPVTPHANSLTAHPSRELRPRTLNLLDKSHVIPEYEEETSYIAPPSGVKHSQSCDAIIQRPNIHEKLNFIIYI